MPELRYHHDHQWYTIGGTSTREGFKAKLNETPNFGCANNDSLPVRWDEWEWINSTPEDTFQTVLVGGFGPDQNKLFAVELSKPGLYTFSVHLLWANEFDAKHGIVMHDTYGFPSVVYANWVDAFFGLTYDALFIRRYLPQDEVLTGPYAQVFFESAQNSGSIQFLDFGSLDPGATFMEMWRVAT